MSITKQMDNNLLNRYVEENSDIFTTDGELLFCKVCNKSVPCDSHFRVNQHLTTQTHLAKDAAYQLEKEELTELLNQYILENSNVFETDGEVLFCKACNTLVTFKKKGLVDQHLRTQKHIENCTELEETSLFSNEDLLNKYVLENGDVYETDQQELFCKICKTTVPYDKKLFVYQHLRSEKHNDLCKENIKTESSMYLTELLNKYVSENRKVLETDGKVLFCKICNKAISFETKYSVYRHLRSGKHIDNTHVGRSGTKSELQRYKSTADKLLKKYISENKEVFETDGGILFCKVCKISVSFHKKFSVDQHLKTQKHKDNFAQSLGNAVPKDLSDNKEVVLGQSIVEILNRYVSENSDVFETDGEILFCKVCKKSVSFGKKFSVDQHLKTQKHNDNFAQSLGNAVPKDLSGNKECIYRESTVELLNRYVSENSDVFETDGEILFCKVCKKSVSFSKKFSVDQHLKTQKHKYNFAKRFAQDPCDISTGVFVGENSSINLELNEDLCRTCMRQISKTMQKDERRRITEVSTICGNNRSLMEILEVIQPQIKVEIKANFPTFMCSECVRKLLVAYEFIEMYRNVDKKLRTMLEELDVDNSYDNNSDDQQKFFEEMEVHDNFADTKYEIKIEQLNIDELNQQDGENECSELEDELYEDTVNIESIGSNSSDEDWITEKCWLNVSENKQNSDDSTNSPQGIHVNNEKSRIEELDDEGLQCPKCESVFGTVKLMREHMRQNHVEKKPKRAYNRRTNQPRKTGAARVLKNIPSKQGGSYQCEYCEKRYSNYIFYRTHMRVHTVERHLCIECGKSFTRLSSFNTHMLRHRGEKNYQCPQCPKSFVCSSGLYGHMMVHTNNKPYVCDICGAAFHMAYQLRHHNLYHAGIKKFQCEYCDMRFVTREKQRRHMRTHTGEKPYRCKYCEKAFAQSNDCVKHLRQHLGDNVYQCDLCPLRFPLVRDLRVHFATHKDDDEETRNRNLQARMEEERELQKRLCSKEPV